MNATAQVIPLTKAELDHMDHRPRLPLDCDVCVNRRAMELGLKPSTLRWLWDSRHNHGRVEGAKEREVRILPRDPRAAAAAWFLLGTGFGAVITFLVGK